MSVGEWCEDHSITKANYYYRMTEVRKACLEQASIQMPEQSIVPITDTLLTKVQETKAVSAESTIREFTTKTPAQERLHVYQKL